ncbi:MAG: hypothetical protein H6728_11180 [Myxococcales bacterium]|nr:hypothetical protein [Myxococcales bacterium]MCB9643624.1 hypothetical protein [Myxococcales bacterium]
MKSYLSSFAFAAWFGLSASLVWAAPPTSRPVSRKSHDAQQEKAKRIASEKARRTKDPLVARTKRIGGLLAASLVKHGLDPDNPWMLAHMLLAFGPNLRLADGQLAIDRIVRSSLQFHEVNGKKIPYFPKGTDTHRIEPHPFMHIKTMLYLGVPMSHVFDVNGTKVTLAELFRGLVMSFPSQIPSRELAEFAWAFDAMYGRLPKNQWVWENAKGEKVQFLKLLWSAMQQLEADTRFLRDLKAQGAEVIQKKRQGVHAYSCGGLHFVQAMIHWAGFSAFRGRLQPFLRQQIDLVFFRMKGEVALYQNMLRQYGKNKTYRFLLNLQQMKFLGHSLETLMLSYRWGLWRPTKAERLLVREGLTQLLNAIEVLQQMGFYSNPEPIKQKVYQYYLDLIGDAGHAVHALRLMPYAMFEP